MKRSDIQITHPGNSQSISRPKLIINWLTKIPSTHPEIIYRRANLLAWLLLSIFLLLVIGLTIMIIVNFTKGTRQSEYIQLITGLIILTIIAYFLNRSGYYQVSAGLTVAIAVLGPWGSMIMDTSILQGDFVPLAYITLSILLSSILLRPVFTTFLAIIQIIILFFVPAFSSASIPINWPSFLIYIFFTSVFSILSNIISQSDLTQIYIQTQKLIESSQKLKEESIRDPLTNLFNRFYLNETLDREISRAEREHVTVGIIMADIDQFKHFNDTYGHFVGDIVLIEFSSLVKSIIRDADIACRFGGEEFLLVLPGASQEVTINRAELCRKLVSELHLVHQQQKLEEITISVGVSIYPNHGANGHAVLNAADSALYQAKNTGRNRVVVANL